MGGRRPDFAHRHKHRASRPTQGRRRRGRAQTVSTRLVGRALPTLSSRGLSVAFATVARAAGVPQGRDKEPGGWAETGTENARQKQGVGTESCAELTALVG